MTGSNNSVHSIVEDRLRRTTRNRRWCTQQRKQFAYLRPKKTRQTAYVGYIYISYAERVATETEESINIHTHKKRTGWNNTTSKSKPKKGRKRRENVVVCTLSRSFYPTTSAVPPVSFLILHPREIPIMWSQTVRQKNQTLIKVGKSSAGVPGTRAQQNENATRKVKARKKKVPRTNKKKKEFRDGVGCK